MKIVHVTGYFSQTMAYQENLLPVGQAKLGHDVYVLTGVWEPDFGFNSRCRREPVGGFSYNGITVYRLPDYFEVVNRGPVLRGLLLKIRELCPDVLFIHDIGPSLVIGILYKLIYPSTRLQVDCHSTPSNARKSTLGPLYHGLFGVLFRIFRKKFDRIFPTAPETIEFMARYYGLDVSDLVLLPLPGDASLLKDHSSVTEVARRDLGLSSANRLLIHTGKLPRDKETLAVLKMFRQLKGDHLRLLIVGQIDAEFRVTFDEFLMADSRIVNIGWADPVRLRHLLIASDLLVQPGSLSNTFIDAICCGLPVVLDDTPQGRYLTSWNNGVVVGRGSVKDLLNAVSICLEAPQLSSLKVGARSASHHFDYVENARMTLEHISE